jgi:hypothetical protein
MERGAFGIWAKLPKWFNKVVTPAYDELDGKPTEASTKREFTCKGKTCRSSYGRARNKYQISHSKLPSYEELKKYIHPPVK